jgi:NAD(P)-dependent dehydrogenase (short-subunit alcohol dehydrogenase family)
MDIKTLFGFEGKNVVITGAGSGMGKAAAQLLTELKASVFTVDRRPLDFCVTKEFTVDLSDRSEIDTLVSKLPARIDALFICHGIADSVDHQNAILVNLTNFYSFKYLTEMLLPRIADYGSVTFISSFGGREWRESISDCLEIIDCNSWGDAVAWYNIHPEVMNPSGYVFSKKCQNVYVMSKVHSPEFIDRKIRLNAIAPGYTITSLSEDFNKSINGDSTFGKKVLEGIFLGSWNGRAATPAEMGFPLVAIGSKLFSYMSG